MHFEVFLMKSCTNILCIFYLSGDVTSGGLNLSWTTLFQIFMFSLSLSTGLQPEIAPLSPYTLVLANVNALFAQLIFVFLSGAGIYCTTGVASYVVAYELALICLTGRMFCIAIRASKSFVLCCSICKVVAAFTTSTVLNCCINLSISCSAQTKGGYFCHQVRA
jgi:hypothetical protein